MSRINNYHCSKKSASGRKSADGKNGIKRLFGKELLWWSRGWDPELSVQGARVQSLARELRSYRPQGTAKKIKLGTSEKIQKDYLIHSTRRIVLRGCLKVKEELAIVT